MPESCLRLNSPILCEMRTRNYLPATSTTMSLMKTEIGEFVPLSNGSKTKHGAGKRLLKPCIRLTSRRFIPAHSHSVQN